MSIWMLFSFLFFMLIFTGVGLASARVKKDTTDDYLVAGRGIHPAMAALSAVSTWNSGYMFIGIVGFTWAMGYSVYWSMIASTCGQILAWIFIFRWVRKQAEEKNVRSLSTLIGNGAGSPEAKLAAIITVLFLSIYAAAQLTAGGKALFVLMDWPIWIGILLGGILVVAYCFAGGIRASIWTDSVQSIVMLIGGTVLCWTALSTLGGFSGLNNSLNEIDPALTSIWPASIRAGFLLWVGSFFLGGVAVAGQPHVVSRILTLADEEDRKKAQIWFFVWQIPFVFIMLLVGLSARALFNSSGIDPELGMPTIANELLGPAAVGMILASIFAATMSTADSQVLACTAAVCDDIKPEWGKSRATAKKVTLGVAAFATLTSILALFIPGGDNVFDLVVIAVYTLGSVFVPLLVIRMAGYKPSSNHSIIMMISAVFAVIVWRMTGWNYDVFDTVPGMGAAFLAHFVMRAMDSNLPSFDFSRKKITTFGLVILLPFAALETTFQLNQPEAGGLVGPAPDSMWNLTVEFAYVYEEQVVQIGDGDTQTFSFDIPSDAMGVTFGLNYSESNEGGILQQCDDVNSVFDDSGIPSQFLHRNLVNLSGQNCGDNDLGGFSTWAGFAEINTHMEQILAVHLLTIEKDEGEILFDVRVDVNRGTPVNGDSGEDITIVMMYHTVESWTLTEVE
jgi:sodium/proline symporter